MSAKPLVQPRCSLQSSSNDDGRGGKIGLLEGNMDYGHYNCRDYHITPHFAPTTLTSNSTAINSERSTKTGTSPFYRSPFARHESFDELEQRSRSPASSKPKFPLLQLPVELRQHIFKYLLPRTIEHTDPNPLANHARNFSAVKKRGARGMVIPQAKDPSQKDPSHVVWQRGNISLLMVCRQLHEECAELLYGGNTFLLFVTYSDIKFRYSWLLPSGLAPNRRYDFLELLPKRYMTLIKRLMINIDHVDSYTSMIKFNVSGKGLTHGLRKQVQRLVDALQQPSQEAAESICVLDQENSVVVSEERRLARITVRVTNGNAFLDQVKSEAVKQREGSIRTEEDIQEMLEPFGDLRAVRDVNITGAITPAYACDLARRMKSRTPLDRSASLARKLHDLDLPSSYQLCCYGNDL